MDAKMPSREGFWCATNRMRSVLPHRRRFPRRRALPNQACSVASIDPPAEPQLPFRFPNQCLLMLALWSCGRRRSVVQAQRQIHRAFTGSYAATYALRHTRHADPPLALARKIGATRLFISVSNLRLVVAQLSCLWLALTSLALFEPIAVAVHFEDVDVVGQSVEQRTGQPLGPEHAGPLVER